MGALSFSHIERGSNKGGGGGHEKFHPVLMGWGGKKIRTRNLSIL